MSDFKDLPNCPFCGTPPDDQFELSGRAFCIPCDITIQIEDWKNVNKHKAAAVWEAAEALYCLNVSNGHGDEDEFAIKYFKSYANKLEKR